MSQSILPVKSFSHDSQTLLVPYSSTLPGIVFKGIFLRNVPFPFCTGRGFIAQPVLSQIVCLERLLLVYERAVRGAGENFKAIIRIHAHSRIATHTSFQRRPA
jgi:hypothetical protein